jgi:hypothetical protein
MKAAYVLILTILTVIVCSHCSSEKQHTSPAGYQLTQPDKYFLPEMLTEISGIAFHNYNADTTYAIQDEEGRLFYFKTGRKGIDNTKYAKHGDYEDVAICNNTVVVLKSNGSFYTFPFSEVRTPQPDSVTEYKKILPEGEYEGLYADNATNTLYVLCKQCSADKGNKQVTGYTLQLTQDSLLVSSSFSIDMGYNNLIDEKEQKKIRPSALAKNVLTNEWYILSSVNKLLLVTNNNWQLKAVHELKPGVFHHPEGMAFDKDGNLYISNEGDETTVANMLRFTYRKP